MIAIYINILLAFMAHLLTAIYNVCVQLLAVGYVIQYRMGQIMLKIAHKFSHPYFCLDWSFQHR